MISEVYAQLQTLLMDVVGVYIFVLIAGAVVILFAIALGAEYFKFRGPRIVMCPKSHQPAMVEVDAFHAATGRFVAEKDLRLLRCSRWEASQSCDRECLKNWR